jgi:hypothetical protein
MATIDLNEELTPEGAQMFENIEKYQRLNLGLSVLPEEKKPRKPRITQCDVELNAIKIQIAKLIKNSEMVIKNCDKIIAKYTRPEEIRDPETGKWINSSVFVRKELKFMKNGYYCPDPIGSFIIKNIGMNN